MRNKKVLVFQDLFQDDYRANICRTEMTNHFFGVAFDEEFKNEIRFWNLLKNILDLLNKTVFSLIDGARILKIFMKQVLYII